jgi:hypothetical protein
LDAGFAAAVDACVGPLTGAFIGAEGCRSLARSQSLYAAYKAGGPLAAPPGDSPHNYGLAVDLQLRGAGGLVWYPDIPPDVLDLPFQQQTSYLDRCPSQWVELWRAVYAASLLHSLWTYGDGDHIERVDWRRFIPAAAVASTQ